MSELADDTVAVVVHYRNYRLIGQTLCSLIEQGIPAERILIVDTSDEPDGAERLEMLIPAGVTALQIENKGYGNAVNTGIRHWAGVALPPRFVLVATHEVSWMPLAVDRLRSALAAAPEAAAAGPTLVTGAAPYSVWSEGGVLSGKLGLPRHIGHRRPFRPEILDKQPPQERGWLDGSCVLYDFAAIAENPIDETYFLYMEETDLHLRLAKLGRQILWVPNAVAWQSSKGIPAEYSTRNLRLLYARSGRAALGRIAVPLDAARQLASSAKKGRLRENLRPLLRGLTVALPPRQAAPSASANPNPNPNIITINPLGAALRHYTKALLSVLEAEATTIELREFFEPSASGQGRLSWVLEYCRQLRAARGLTENPAERILIITWPVLGHLDTLLIALFYRRPAWLVIHDPTPMVRAIGYGRASRRIGRSFSKNTRFIVHSAQAQAALAEHGLTGNTVLLPHPVLAPSDKARLMPGLGKHGDARPTVRVLGQYKADRDLSVLTRLAKDLSNRYTLEIFGRGWPPVAGWTVTEGFMTEAEMVRRISDADVVLIPYSRFFQSGIAIRAIEAGTPVVGLNSSSLTDLLGRGSPLLVDGSEDTAGWAHAIEFAVADGTAAMAGIATGLRQSAVAAWQVWSTDGPGPRARTLVVLGKANDADRGWLESDFIKDVVRFSRPAVSGSRFGSRVLGLGIDSAIVAAMSLRSPGPFLAMNPWIAVALKLTGKRDVAVVGMYAERGSGSFRVLRRVLSSSPVLTTAEIEASEWKAAGGRALPVLFGGNFNYPSRAEPDASRLKIFVGGSSDRDTALLDLLIAEIRAGRTPCSLVVVSTDSPKHWSNEISSITYTGFVPGARFGELLAESDVVFLPIRQGRRAAGHMVMSGALESGVPVLTNHSSGMQGYVDGTFVAQADVTLPLLPQLAHHAEAMAAEGPAIRAFWQQQFCRAAFIERIFQALHTMELAERGTGITGNTGQGVAS